MVVHCQSDHWGKLFGSMKWKLLLFPRCSLDQWNDGKNVLKLRFKFHFSLAVTRLSSVSCWNAMKRPNLYQINVNTVRVWMVNPLIYVLLNDDYDKKRLIVLSKFTIPSSYHLALSPSPSPVVSFPITFSICYYYLFFFFYVLGIFCDVLCTKSD